MSIIRLKDNHQMPMALKYPSAKECRAKNGGGHEYLYTLENGNLIYVSAQGHAEIQSLHLAAGEPFILAKMVGAEKQVTWEVERIHTEPGDPPQELPASAAIEQPQNGVRKPLVAAKSITNGKGPIPPTLTTPESRRIFSQLVAVIQGAQAAEQFAKSIDYDVKFSEESIRAMAISGFIEQSRRAA